MDRPTRKPPDATIGAARFPARPAPLAGAPSNRVLIAVLISGLLVFAVLAVLVVVRWVPLINLDTSGTAATYHAALSSGWLRGGARVVTAVGSPVAVDLIAAVAVLGLALARRWRPVLAVTVARLGELGIESLVKVVLDRQRPVFTGQLATASGASFPSGHAAGSAALYVVLLLLVMPWLVRRWQRFAVMVIVVLLVLAIAGSRLLLGVHYPSDVVAGLGLGSACAAAAVLLIRARSRQHR